MTAPVPLVPASPEEPTTEPDTLGVEGNWKPLRDRYGLPADGNWASWQAGRAWARQHEFYGQPDWCRRPLLRGFVMANAIAAPILIIVAALGWFR